MLEALGSQPHVCWSNDAEAMKQHADVRGGSVWCGDRPCENKTGTIIQHRAERRRAKSKQINRNASATTKLIQAGSLPWRSYAVGWCHGSGDPVQIRDPSRTTKYDLGFNLLPQSHWFPLVSIWWLTDGITQLKMDSYLG